MPLGKPECLVENLDRWGADEILVQVIDRSLNDLGPDFELLVRLGAMGLETPLIYAGGIRSVEDGVKLIQSGADRIVIDSLLHDNLQTVRRLGAQLGAQALIASLPLSIEDGSLAWLDHRTRKSSEIAQEVLVIIRSGVLSEVFVADWQNEGMPAGFEHQLLELFPLKEVPIIAFGGISEQAQMRKLMQSNAVAAVAVGNFLSYREHAIQEYKKALIEMPVRLATYKSTYPLISDA
jgi:cyclase